MLLDLILYLKLYLVKIKRVTVFCCGRKVHFIDNALSMIQFQEKIISSIRQTKKILLMSFKFFKKI